MLYAVLHSIKWRGRRRKSEDITILSQGGNDKDSLVLKRRSCCLSWEGYNLDLMMHSLSLLQSRILSVVGLVKLMTDSTVKISVSFSLSLKEWTNDHTWRWPFFLVTGWWQWMFCESREENGHQERRFLNWIEFETLLQSRWVFRVCLSFQLMILEGKFELSEVFLFSSHEQFKLGEREDDDDGSWLSLLFVFSSQRTWESQLSNLNEIRWRVLCPETVRSLSIFLSFQSQLFKRENGLEDKITFLHAVKGSESSELMRMRMCPSPILAVLSVDDWNRGNEMKRGHGSLIQYHHLKKANFLVVCVELTRKRDTSSEASSEVGGVTDTSVAWILSHSGTGERTFFLLPSSKSKGKGLIQRGRSFVRTVHERERTKRRTYTQQGARAETEQSVVS